MFTPSHLQEGGEAVGLLFQEGKFQASRPDPSPFEVNRISTVDFNEIRIWPIECPPLQCKNSLV